MLSRNIKKKSPKTKALQHLKEKKNRKAFYKTTPNIKYIYFGRKNDECWLVYSVSTCMLVIKKNTNKLFYQTIEKSKLYSKKNENRNIKNKSNTILCFPWSLI